MDYFPFHIRDVIQTPLTNSYFSRWLIYTPTSIYIHGFIHVAYDVLHIYIYTHAHMRNYIIRYHMFQGPAKTQPPPSAQRLQARQLPGAGRRSKKAGDFKIEFLESKTAEFAENIRKITGLRIFHFCSHLTWGYFGYIRIDKCMELELLIRLQLFVTLHITQYV